MDQISPEVIEQITQQLLEQINAASPWSQSVFGLIILLLILAVFVSFRLYLKSQTRIHEMANEYLKATMMMTTLKLRIEDNIKQIADAEKVLKESARTAEMQQKALESLERAIENIQKISSDLAKLAWKYEDSKDSEEKG